MHISDWFPTLIHLAGGDETTPPEDVMPLDGVNNWQSLASSGGESSRTEILHNINPMYNSRFLWFQCGNNLAPTTPYNNSYGIDTTKGNGALRMNDWKLIIGDPGRCRISNV